MYIARNEYTVKAVDREYVSYLFSLYHGAFCKYQ